MGIGDQNLGRLTPGKGPDPLCTVGWIGPRAGREACGKIPPYRDSIPGPPSLWLVAIPTTLSWPTTTRVNQMKTLNIFLNTIYCAEVVQSCITFQNNLPHAQCKFSSAYNVHKFLKKKNLLVVRATT